MVEGKKRKLIVKDLAVSHNLHTLAQNSENYVPGFPCRNAQVESKLRVGK